MNIELTLQKLGFNENQIASIEIAIQEDIKVFHALMDIINVGVGPKRKLAALMLLSQQTKLHQKMRRNSRSHINPYR